MPILLREAAAPRGRLPWFSYIQTPSGRNSNGVRPVFNWVQFSRNGNAQLSAMSLWQKSRNSGIAGETACATFELQQLAEPGGAGIQPAGLLPHAAMAIR